MSAVHAVSSLFDFMNIGCLRWIPMLVMCSAWSGVSTASQITYIFQRYRYWFSINQTLTPAYLTIGENGPGDLLGLQAVAFNGYGLATALGPVLATPVTFGQSAPSTLGNVRFTNPGIPVAL